jgi:UDP-2,3-diacylglucosamine pyrophosphatase LpxH
MGRCFLEHGVVVLPDAVSITCGESRVHLSHGDQFCIHDRSYQFWARTVLRAAPLRFCVRNLPVAVAIWLARRYRGVSRRKFARHRRTHDTRLPTVLDGVHQLLRSDPHDVVICGHIHHLADTSLDVQGRPVRLLTTGAWEQGPNHIEWSDGAFRLRGLEDPHPVARR